MFPNPLKFFKIDDKKKRLKYFCIILLILGIIFRFSNLGLKFYWDDEVRSSMRISGYLEPDVIEAVYTGKPIAASELDAFHFPRSDTPIAAPLRAFVHRPEHPPLYYLSAHLWLKFWMQWFPDEVAAIRSWSATISLLAFPCIYWLAIELFKSTSMAWLSVAVIASSPLHLMYAYEARQYSLWTATILFSSAALLRAIRLSSGNSIAISLIQNLGDRTQKGKYYSQKGEYYSQKDEYYSQKDECHSPLPMGIQSIQVSSAVKSWLAWGTYAIGLALGLYTHLLFILVAIAHGVYLLLTHQLKLPQIVRGYCTSIGLGLLAFSPWIWVIISNSTQTGEAIAEGDVNSEVSFLFDRWFRNLNRVFFGMDFGFANIFTALLIFYLLYRLSRYTSRSVWLFPLSLIGVNFLAIAIPDLLLGGVRSAGIRYLFPAYIGCQLTLASIWLLQRNQGKAWQKFLWRFGLISILLMGTGMCAFESQTEVTWSKSDTKAKYYIPAAKAIEQYPNPLVISDASPLEVLTLSYRLRPDIHLLLTTQPKTIAIPDDYSSVFLFNPSGQLKQSIEEAKVGQLNIVVQRKDDPANSLRLWKLIR